MPRLAPGLRPEKNCMRIFKRTQTKGLSKLLLSKNKFPISSMNLKSQLRQSNSYLQVGQDQALMCWCVYPVVSSWRGVLWMCTIFLRWTDSTEQYGPVCPVGVTAITSSVSMLWWAVLCATEVERERFTWKMSSQHNIILLCMHP